ncbi:MAG TPA: Clp protease N-terminal domain-containing protein [Actinospica sp.]|jgi:ATP-dependent Clp protease ATP-binding subunit ClpC|nr:Clp protease N-terminal domain-containing protein [Actinospica sp.]
MFERFTARARHVVVLSQEEARRLSHNYIGTEHILLGLLGELDGLAYQVLAESGLTLDGAREEVVQMVGAGKQEPKGHIPFTPRAKKTLELSLREALTLHHNYIGTEHILLGLIREGDGVAAQIMKQHGDLLAIRTAMLDRLPAGPDRPSRGRSWFRPIGRRFGESEEEATEPGEATALSATPAADATLTAAARMAGQDPVGSHHLLLAALADADSAAARALAALGVDLTQAQDALRQVDVAGTSDEQPEEAGRRQMNIKVDGELVTIVATDPVLVADAKAALRALAGQAGQAGVSGETGETGLIRGADLRGAPAAGLSAAWQALHESLEAIQRTAPPANGPGQPAAEAP